MVFSSGDKEYDEADLDSFIRLFFAKFCSGNSDEQLVRSKQKNRKK
tara:strand:+ start:32810 stop:32947 length:138 start_codon:yes stop_codon:yes gene_type:complete